MACLVTGGTGYIGSYVVRDLLQEGREVICLQRSGVTPVAREIIGEDNLDKVRIVQGDVSNTVQFFDLIREHGVDLIIHIGYSIPPTSEQQPAYALRVNCIGMNNVLEAVRLFGLKRVIWTSSGFSLGHVYKFYKERIGDDDAIYMPTSMYGATKALNEFMAKLYFEKFGVDSIGFRLPLTFGIGRWHGVFEPLMQFLRKAALNIPVLDIPVTVRNADVPKGYLYVEDLSNLIAEVCDVPTTKTRMFNLVEGEYTWREVVETIRKINPQAQMVVEEEEHGIVKAYPSRECEVDSTGVRTELGWQPKYSLEESLRKVFNYFRQKEGMPPL